MAPKKKVTSTEEFRRKKKEAERRRRAKIKADPVKYAESLRKEKERRIKRKEAKKIPTIGDLLPRDQRAQRKEWRERQRKCRELKKTQDRFARLLRENTPSTDTEIDEIGGRSPSLVQRPYTPPAIDSPRNTESPSVLCSYDIPVNSPGISTPTSSVASGISRQKEQGAKTAKRNRNAKNILLKKQSIIISTMKKKVHSLQVQNARLLAKIVPKKRVKIIKKRIHERKIAVQNFLEEDINSKMCPGKKDTITKHSVKKQKRILCDSLERLHKKYNTQVHPSLRVSYATFCRFRPFWVVNAKLAERNTCLCSIHENFILMFEKLRYLNIIEAQNTYQIISSLVCDSKSYDCMHRKCRKCAEKIPHIKEFENDQITYKQWIAKNESRLVRGKEKIIRRTVKEEMQCSKKELVEKFLKLLPRMLSHCFNIQTQYQALKTLKDNLKSGEILLHVDFSENYSCKYFSEIQSTHFGYRPQISLHTGVLYFRSDSGTIETISFCTASDCLRHDACAVYAHLKKALTHLIDFRNISVLHLASDGPSSQYKNKNNFYLFSQHLLKTFDISLATWNFSEAGHGKGAPDGIGAAIKQTADSYVTQGNDIPDFETFYDIVKTKSNVILYKVTEEDILEAEQILKSWNAVKSIPGTKKMHQLTWSEDIPNMINLRELSCIECPIQNQSCPHFDSSTHLIKKYTQDHNEKLPIINMQKNQNVKVEKGEGTKKKNKLKLARSDNEESIDRTEHNIQKLKVEKGEGSKKKPEIKKTGLNNEEDVKRTRHQSENAVKIKILEGRNNDDDLETVDLVENEENEPPTNISYMNKKEFKSLVNYSKGDFVICKFVYDEGTRKQTEKRFVGQVLDFAETHLFVNFLRKSNKTENTFIFPNVNDEQLVNPEQVLTKSSPIKISRGRYTFSNSIGQYNCS